MLHIYIPVGFSVFFFFRFSVGVRTSLWHFYFTLPETHCLPFVYLVHITNMLIKISLAVRLSVRAVQAQIVAVFFLSLSQ